MLQPSTQHSEITSQSVPGRPWLMLALATLGFALNFWAWVLLSPRWWSARWGGHPSAR